MISLVWMLFSLNLSVGSSHPVAVVLLVLHQSVQFSFPGSGCNQLSVKYPSRAFPQSFLSEETLCKFEATCALDSDACFLLNKVVFCFHPGDCCSSIYSGMRFPLSTVPLWVIEGCLHAQTWRSKVRIQCRTMWQWYKISEIHQMSFPCGCTLPLPLPPLRS